MPDLTTMIFLAVVPSVIVTAVIVFAVMLIIRRAFAGAFGPPGHGTALANSAEHPRTIASGESAQATVLKLWNSGTTAGGVPMIGLLLEVRPFNRPTYQAQTDVIKPRSQTPAFESGQVIRVRIDPTDPSKVVVAMSRSPRWNLRWGGSSDDDDEDSDA